VIATKPSRLVAMMPKDRLISALKWFDADVSACSDEVEPVPTKNLIRMSKAGVRARLLAARLRGLSFRMA
jgi:hypothetical protein